MVFLSSDGMRVKRYSVCFITVSFIVNCCSHSLWGVGIVLGPHFIMQYFYVLSCFLIIPLGERGLASAAVSEYVTIEYSP